MDNLSSDELVLYNLNDNKVLFEKDSGKEVSIASLTKIMTAILGLEKNKSLDKKVTITSQMTKVVQDYVVAGLEVGQKVSLEDLLYITLLPSAADAAQAVAIETSGSIEKFVELMNKKAKELGMKHTHFSNPVGIDGDNYSTAEDVATLLKYALKNEKFKKIFESFSYYSSSLDRTFIKTIKKNGVISGAKTGFTGDAGRCLASTSTINGVNYLLVNLGAEWRNGSTKHIEDALTIYDYYSSNYGYRNILKAGDVIFDLSVSDSKTKSLDFLAKEDVEAYLKNDLDLESLNYSYDGIKNITNDNKVGDFLGTYRIENGEDLLYETPIYLETEIKFYPYWLWNSAVVAGVLLLIFLMLRKKRRHSRRNFTRRAR